MHCSPALVCSSSRLRTDYSPGPPSASSPASLSVNAHNSLLPPSIDDASVLTQTTPTPAEAALQQWFDTAVYSTAPSPLNPTSFFPNDTTWPPHFDAAFARTASCSFNQPHHSAAALKAVYYTIDAFVTAAYSDFVLQLTGVTAVPNADATSGLVVATGLELGPASRGGESAAAYGVFAVVSEMDGLRLIAEWRESLDFGFGS
ncbi:hypothetical protein MMC18_001533 [Xylographa bjoerkii]|nr:hypothetical protein [Xylographa bjoerkii]